MLRGFLMEDAPRKIFLARFVAHCESCAQDIEIVVLVIGVS